MNPRSLPEEPSRDDTCVIEDEQFVAAKQVREFKEKLILEVTGIPVQQQKSRGFTAIQRPLRDLLLWEMVVELVQSHESWSLAELSQTPGSEKTAVEIPCEILRQPLGRHSVRILDRE